MIYLASDHGGFHLKNYLVDKLIAEDYEVEDLGSHALDVADDYPDYVLPLVEKVLENTENKGILVCRNGVGVSMLANKFSGIRAVLSWDELHVKSSRVDDDANILALPADYLEDDKAYDIVKIWLETEFSEEERHVRRLGKVNIYGDTSFNKS